MNNTPLTPQQEKLRAQLRTLSDSINEQIQQYRLNTFGRIATIIESSIADENQRKSVKDLASNAIYGPSYWNGIRRQFDLLCKAQGFDLHDELTGLKEHNPYE